MSNPYLKNLKTVVFDIETMGLSPAKNMVINAGFCDPSGLDKRQLFAESVEDEKNLLEDIISILSEYDAVITYNGDSFDIPFIKTRCKKWGIEFEPRFWSIDIYRYLKKYWPMAERLPHLNQKSVEIALGLSDDRTDEIGGGECIPLYENYLKTGDIHSKELILLHNADDIIQLAGIYTKAIFLPYDRICFERGFALKTPEPVFVNSIRLDKNKLYVEASKAPAGIPSSIFDEAYELEYDSFSGLISLKINLSQRDNGTQFVDLNSLPCNKEAFAQYVGFHYDFLVLSDSKGLYYKEINDLIANIFTVGNLF